MSKINTANLTFKKFLLENTAIRTKNILPAIFAAILGVSILYGVGFAAPSALHDMAHDSRHSLSFPCH